jgi:hypothetical protein
MTTANSTSTTGYYAQYKDEIDESLRQDEEFARQVAGKSDAAKRRIKARMASR